MNSQQNSIYAMFIRVLRVLDDHQTAWATNAKFAANRATLSANVQSIAKAQKEQETDKTGITRDKETSREVLASLAFEAASGIRSYAADTDNRELEQSVKFTEAGLAAMTEARLTATSEVIHTAGVKHLAQLAEYGLTTESLESLKTAIDNFKGAQPETRLAINNSTQATITLRKLLTATTDLLKRQLDTKMVMFKKSHEGFYNAYSQARNIIEPGAPAKKEEGKEEQKKG